MTKQAKWWQDARLDDVPEQTRFYIRHYYKRGEKFSDLEGLGFWFGNGKSNDPWIAAFQAIDEHDDTAPLLKLLDAGEPPPPALLADLLRRRPLKKKVGGRATPKYRRSDADVALIIAVEDVRRLRRKDKKSVTEALEQISQARRIPYGILKEAYAGRRGASRR
jgi:hypothetical protein